MSDSLIQRASLGATAARRGAAHNYIPHSPGAAYLLPSLAGTYGNASAIHSPGWSSEPMGSTMYCLPPCM